MAQIDFYAGEGHDIVSTSTSGLGFYGDNGFGYSVAIGSYQGRTYITDSTGTVQGPEVDNNKYHSTSGVIIGQTGTPIHLLQLPNYQSTLNIRFTNDDSVQVQNVTLYGSSRSDYTQAPSGINLYAASIIHPNDVQDMDGSGSATWTQLTGSGSTLTLTDSPGTSGLSPNGEATQDTRHDWYVAISASPSSIGAKEGKLYIELEYL